MFHGTLDKDEHHITEAYGKAAADVVGLRRPYNPTTSAVLNTMMDPVPFCVVMEAIHIQDEKFREVTQAQNIEVMQLCPVHEGDVIQGYVGVYLEEGDKRDLLESLEELSEKL